MNYILRPAAALLITAVIVVAALSVVYNLTLEPIEKQKQKTQEAAIRDVLPGTTDFREIQIENTGDITAVFECTSGGTLTGYVVRLSPEGYSGNIDLITGISASSEKISGMRIMRHSETPGLGALAVKENFYRQYDNRALAPLSVTRTSPGVNDIQAITSATITTRAVTKAVNEAVEWYISYKGSGVK
ncbi:MAG: RnfABCDGE type electron transport complex subunit G [Treponema sp.]|jgi:electron transport complex protein RnfG|nr:RnfABCDGE type electron transport complex subunit G [Treponema sp.]